MVGHHAADAEDAGCGTGAAATAKEHTPSSAAAAIRGNTGASRSPVKAVRSPNRSDIFNR